MKLRYSFFILFLLFVLTFHTQAEDHQHHYGEWAFEGEQMYRRCKSCDLLETKEIDRELYLESLLSGYWETDIYSMQQVDKTLKELSLVASLHFDKDHCITLHRSEDAPILSSWYYCDYAFVEGKHTYSAFFDYGNASLPFELTISSNGHCTLALHLSSHDMLFIQATEAAKLLATTWCVADSKVGGKLGNPENWLAFNEDRTVTGYLDGAVEGTWYLSTSSNSNTFNEYDITIKNAANGRVQYLSGYIRTDGKYAAPLTLNNQSFVATTQEHVDRIIAAPRLILGTWKSIYTEEFEQIITDAYSITFNEDRTFNAKLNKEYSGRWSISEFTNFNDDRSILYQLHFDGSRDPFFGELTFISGRFGAVSNEFIVHGTPKNEMLKTVFACYPDDTTEFMKQAIGAWQLNGYSCSFSDNPMKIHEITFHHDGTFSAVTDKKVKGSWYPVAVELDTGNDRMLKYHAFLSDKMFEMYISNGEDLFITWDNSNGDSLDYYFFRNAQ